MVQHYDNRKGRGLRLLCSLVAGAWIVATWVAALLMLRDMGAFWSVVGVHVAGVVMYFTVTRKLFVERRLS